MTRSRVTLFSLPWSITAASADFLIRSAGILLSLPARCSRYGLSPAILSAARSLAGAWFLSLWRQGFSIRRPHFLGMFDFTLSTGRTMNVAAQLLPLDSNPVLVSVRIADEPAGYFLIERGDADDIAAAVSPGASRKPIHDLLVMALPSLPQAPERMGITSTFRSVLRWLLW